VSAGLDLGAGLLACSVCFGDPTSPLAKGAEAGVWVMIGVIGFVLVAIAGIAVYWAQRAKMLDANDAYEHKPAMKLRA
jgi:hypothetical protein